MSSPPPTTVSQSDSSPVTSNAGNDSSISAGVAQSPDPNLSQSDYTDEQLTRCLRDAEERKQEGTEHFRATRWTEALVMYRSALAVLPRRRNDDSKGKGKAKARAEEDLSDEEDSAPTGRAESPSTGEREIDDGAKGAIEQPVAKELSALERECAKARGVLNANIGACHVKLGEHEEAVKACSEAIADDPCYVKAILRRAQSNEKIGSWAALSSAQDDYNRLIELLPASSKEAKDAERALRAVKPRLEAAQKREVDEMMGKLKGLGNSILGNFGLSTDNFKFEPNGQGGYSMNFVR